MGGRAPAAAGRQLDSGAESRLTPGTPPQDVGIPAGNPCPSSKYLLEVNGKGDMWPLPGGVSCPKMWSLEEGEPSHVGWEAGASCMGIVRPEVGRVEAVMCQALAASSSSRSWAGSFFHPKHGGILRICLLPSALLSFQQVLASGFQAHGRWRPPGTDCAENRKEGSSALCSSVAEPEGHCAAFNKPVTEGQMLRIRFYEEPKIDTFREAGNSKVAARQGREQSPCPMGSEPLCVR